MFLCCGDALFDLFSEPTDSVGTIALHGHVGGSPLNVAAGLARLGNTTAYLAKNSTDIFGQRIESFLRTNNVSLDWIIHTPQNSTLAVIETNAKGSPEYVFYTDNTADVSMRESELPESLTADIGVLHVGSYSTSVDPTASSLQTLVTREKNSRMISYDPNIRPTIEPDIDIWRERFTGLASCSDVVKASDEDIELLFGRSVTADSFATDTLAMGASLVVVTRGADGAMIYSSAGQQAVAAGIKVEVQDTVGAGDTFQAAMLHWLNAQSLIQMGELSTDNIDLEALANFAVTAAAVTCSRRGADLPTLTDIEAFRRT